METRENSYVESGSPEITVGENIGWAGILFSAFPAFKSKNYQLYFSGQLISVIGTWLQIVAEGWLIYQLTHSAFYVGLDVAAATIPSLFLSLFGGVIVDRYPKKRILMFTQSASMVLAFTMGILAILQIITVWEIIALAFLLGVVNAIDLPARHAYITDLIDRKRSLASAVALNSGIFNAARVIGPTIAGLLIAAVGAGWAFIVNGISYIAVIIALFFIRTPRPAIQINLKPLRAIREGLSYTYHHTVIRTLLILSAFGSIFGWSYSTLLPVMASETFHLNAVGLGYLYAAAGAGALLSTIAISVFSRKVGALAFIIGGNLTFSVSLILFTFISNVPLALLLLFLIGAGLVSQFAMTTTVIQHQVDDALRGRVMSVYTLVFLGLSPIGNLEIGFAAEHLGTEMAIRMSAIIMLGVAVYLVTNRKNMTRLRI